MVEKKEILVLGIGNDILSDDGIGPKLVKRLENIPSFRSIDFMTTYLGGLEILELIQGYKKLIIIDAIKTRNGTPGDVYLFDIDSFKETHHISNFHDISFISALKLGEELDFIMPADIKIIAVEIVEDHEFSNEFSIPVKMKYDKIYEEIKEYILNYMYDYINA